jgi:hypothetical protein
MQRPRAVTIISWLFIIFGSIALLSGLWPYVRMTGQQLIVDLKTHWMIHLSRILQIIGGVFMLYGRHWARWLVVVWILFHIVISALHSLSFLLMHVVIFSIILYFLFRPEANAYFRRA